MSVRILVGDCRDVLRTLPAESVHCVVTSPPYWGLRDYGVSGQIGMESSFADFVGEMVEVFRELRRVLRLDGTLWLNLGDSYATSPSGLCKVDNMRSSTLSGGKETGRRAHHDTSKIGRMGGGLKPKDLIGVPWRVAFALQADGWWLRQDIIWSKPNPMPESVTDRCTKAHEYLFLLSMAARIRNEGGMLTDVRIEQIAKTESASVIESPAPSARSATL
jgi:DNA modification methylase